MILYLSLNELWALHLFVRRDTTAPDYGVEWDQEDMVEVYKGIVALEQKQDQTTEYPFPCSSGFAWQITRQVPLAHMVGVQHVGYTLLLKAFTALITEEVHDGLENDYNDASTGTADGTVATA